MAASGTKPKTSMRTLVQMAVAALDNHPSRSPLDDPDMLNVDPSPGSLDLPLPGKPDNRHAAGSGAARGGRSASAPPCVRL
jgi:hypothetical protein